ncbi:MAG: O-antigen ligase family protein [Bacteroidota bacterium]
MFSKITFGLKENKWLVFASLIFCAISLFFLWNDSWYFSLLPIVLFAVYGAIFYTEITFLSLFFFVPISINIEEYTQSFGLFIPTEPMLFGLMLLLVIQQIKFQVFPRFLFKSQLVWIIVFYLLWIFITSITSSNPVASFKFFLAKLWFIIPVFFYGASVFQKRKNILTFLYLFIAGMTIAMLYTLVTHASYQFGEKEGHWVMNPLFKDHTIYGALVAFVLPLVVGIYFSKKHNPLVQLILISVFTINLLALYFSYTRAAWLSIIVALFVLFLIKFKIKFSWILATTVTIGIVVFFSWTAIEQSLAKNNAEHTTEDFGERMESVSNVTSDASNLERLNRWSCAIDMYMERPFFGFGPGTFAFEYARFQEPENLTIISTNFGNGGNAHSEYLGPMAETGTIGLLSVLALIASIFYTGIRLYIDFDKKDKEMRTLILAMILALVTYFFHGILNNYFDTDKAAMPIWAICAIFITLGNLSKSNNQIS